jgi:hypothetical protein
MNDTPSITEEARPGLFILTFSNSRKQGTCQGVLYKSGHVHLDTQDIYVKDFDTLSQMRGYLKQFGYFSINWEDKTA